MKQKLLKSFIAVLFCCGMQAQNAITSSGGDATGSGGSVAFSIGQMTYLTKTGDNGSVSEGVEQPYEISTVLGIDQPIRLSFTSYPNPVTNSLAIDAGNSGLSNLSYQLYDASGHLLADKKMTGNITNVSMETLTSAVYFLKIIQNGTDIKTFKIIKR